MLPKPFSYLNSVPKPAWLSAALAEYGVREVNGPASNERIKFYRALAKTPFNGDDGAVPWCAIFVNAMLEKTAVKGSASGMARSYVRHSAFRTLDQPIIGCIAVKSSNRGPASGHVGFYVGETASRVFLLGGNQDDSVNISDFKKLQFVGYFWPVGVPLPQPPHDKPHVLGSATTASLKPVREA